ncbi:MAG: hypothetical protein IKO19_06715, partial [Candidatus Riflebacteria bacterium]|nr:hypothetical protein [Candidatus Riflebacteria bacterium]
KKLNSIESSDNFNVDELIKAHDKTGRMAGVMRQALDNAVTLQNSAKEEWKEVKDNGIPVKNKNIHAAVIDKTIERILEVYGKPNKIKSFINAFTNDTGITFKDLIDEKNADKFAKYFLPSNNEENKRSFVELQEAIRKQAEELLKKDKALHDRFLSIEIDPFLRKSDDKFYDFNVLAGMKRRIINTAARTVPGKILRFPDWEMHELVPAIKQFAAGSVMPSISALERKAKESLAKTDVEKLAIREAHDNIHIENNYWYILGNLYRHEDDKLIQIKEFDNASLISSRYAGRGNLLKSIYGFNPERTRGFWTNLFDINGSVEANFYEKISNFLKGAKDLDYEPTIISNIRQGFVEPDILKRYDRLIKLNEFVERNVRGFDNSMLENMEEAITQLYNKDKDKYHAAYEIFKILKNGDLSYEGVDSILTKKVFENVISKSAGSKSEWQVFHNLRLNDLINSIFRDPLKAAENITLEDDITGAYYSGAKDGASITRMLQKELSKELILQISHVEATRIDGSSASAYSFDLAKEFLEKSKMNLDDMDKAKELSYATISEHNTGGIFSELGKRTRVPSASKAQDYESLKKQIEAYEDFLAGKTANKGALEASETIFNLIKRSNPPEFLHTSTRMRPDDISALHVDNDFYIVANSEGPFSMLKALNDSIKEGSVSHIKESIMRFAHQLAGGRGDADNVTNLTLVPYFFLHRLGADDLPAFMQFSNQSTSSTWQLIKTLGKRLAPVAIGATYLEWADDTVGAITGTRASAGIINALDYTDIGVRNLLDNIGIGGILEEQSRVNPILQYWFGRDGYYDAEEERNYYANGVEAVRSGRYWAFGSVNEFRGGAIQYYRPNLTRRLNSDYYNKALYDGYFNK